MCYAKQQKKTLNRHSTFLKFSERGTKPLKNIYAFHRGLKYFSKVSCHRPTAVPPEGGGGGWWYSTNRYAGRLRPEVQPLTFLSTSFVRKGTPFLILSTDKKYPFHMPSLKFNIAENALSFVTKN